MASKTYIFRTLFLLVVASLLLPDAVVAARPSRGARGSKSTRRHLQEDTVKKPKKRECKVSQKTDEVKFECKAKNDDKEGGSKIKDEIEFKVKTSDSGLKVKVEYEQEIKTENSETESETQYEIVFDRLVEYQKANNDSDASQAYDWENDNVVQDIALLSWGNFSDVMDDADGVVSTFSVSTPDDVVSFAFHISRADNGADITANKMKFDIQLKDFQWAESDSYVALICSVESKKKVEVDFEDLEQDDVSAIESGKQGKGHKKAKDVRISFEDAVDGIGFVPFGEYTWTDSAVVIDPNATDTSSDATIEVVATSPSDSSSGSKIAFSFIGDAAQSASDIFWDPEAGINYASGAIGSGLLSFGAVIAAAYVTMCLM